ncbi:hypothetical protein ACFYY8_05700 [Streptosporangium sp. NPDC001559]|uniref:hypothetical protein n=1 Tax=Streptosporangium sp. NPDC001559 TaxID=3366187 RepID=UPI0036EA39BE
MLHAFPEKSQWDLLVEHELGEWFSCQWVDTEDVDEIARRLRVDPDSGTPCDFETAMRSYETDPNTLIVWVGEHSPGWSTVLTLSGVTVPPKAMEALSAGRRRVLEAFFVEVADPGKLLYTRDGEYIGEVFPPSSRGGWTEVPEFEAYTSGLELHGAMSDAEVFDRCLCMMGRITGRFVDREWFTSIRTLYRIPEGTWEESR